jgi:uncharacterized membrane protein YqgA involved in biofilm formation
LKGTLVNSGAIIAGSLVGIAAGNRLPERFKTIIMQAIGLSVLVIGIKMAISGEKLVATVGCVAVGAITGELLRIENGIAWIGEWLKKSFRSNSSHFVEGFVSATVLYLTGVMAIIGPIQDGTVGDASLLYIKSYLDGFASIVLASSLGVGVAFSALPIFLVQGAVTLLASSLAFLQEPHILNAVVSTGGVLILGIGFNLLDIKKIPVGNFIPAILYAIIWAVLQ